MHYMYNQPSRSYALQVQEKGMEYRPGLACAEMSALAFAPLPCVQLFNGTSIYLEFGRSEI